MPEIKDVHRLVLKDGTILEQSDCGYADRELWCFLRNVTFFEAFQLFSDPAKFEKIRYEIGLIENYTRITYSGLTQVITVNQTEETVNVRLIGNPIEIKREQINEVKVGDEDNGTVYNQDQNQS